MSDRTLTVTLPDDLADFVEARVRDGDYASADAVVADGLRVLGEEDEHGTVPFGDPAFEAWLREEIVPAIEELDAHPERVIPMKDVFAEARARYRRHGGDAGHD